MAETQELLPEVKQFLDLRRTIPKNKRLPLPTLDTIPQRFIEIAKIIIDISGTWNPVEIYTADPENIKFEQAKVFEAFIQGKEYNPYFTYSHTQDMDFTEQHDTLSDLLLEVQSMRPLDPLEEFAKGAFIYKLRDDLASCHLAEAINAKDEKKIKLLLQWKYPGTDAALLRIAQNFYEQLTQQGAFKQRSLDCLVTPQEYARLQEWELSPEEQMAGFSYGLAEYGILRTEDTQRGYSLIIDERATSLDVRDKTPLGPSLFIPTYRAAPMTVAKFLPLLAHEVEGHARQSVIGHELFLLGGGPLKVDDEQLYEGYAIRIEENCRHELFGIEKKLPRIYYPFAVAMAEQGASFFAIFSDQVQRRIRIAQKISYTEPFPPFSSFSEAIQQKALHQSWRVAYRVMRGHIDMTNKASFAMAKDLGYLRGRLIDRQLQEHGYGYINESAVLPLEVLPSFACFEFTGSDIPKPLQFKNVAKMYWENVLKPQMLG